MKAIIMLLFFSVIIACSKTESIELGRSQPPLATTTIAFSDLAIQVTGETSPFRRQVERRERNGILEYRLKLTSETPQNLPPFSIKLRVPSVDSASGWGARFQSRGQN